MFVWRKRNRNSGLGKMSGIETLDSGRCLYEGCP
jgi:hypothetical protein